jgi:hypothetical protein
MHKFSYQLVFDRGVNIFINEYFKKKTGTLSRDKILVYLYT